MTLERTIGSPNHRNPILTSTFQKDFAMTHARSFINFLTQLFTSKKIDLSL